MEKSLKFAEVMLEDNPHAEFMIDLGESGSTYHMIVAAFEKLGCIVETDEQCPGRMTIRRPPKTYRKT